MGLEQFQVGYSSLWMFLAPCGFPQRPVFCRDSPVPTLLPVRLQDGWSDEWESSRSEPLHRP